VQAERKAWDAARTQLVRSGQLEAWLRTQDKPYVCFATFTDKAADQVFYWPETAARTTPGTAQGMSVTLAVKNAPDDAACLVQTSTDGGRSWRLMPLLSQTWRDYLPWKGREVRYRVTVAGSTQTPDLAAFPNYISPEKGD
jgi:hypothetical protein